jgi:hypothetical protein
MGNTPAADKRHQRKAIDAYVNSLPEDAPIRAIRAAIEDKLLAYEAADAIAMKYQSNYRGWGEVALGASTIGALIGALLLLPPTLIEWLPAGIIGGAQTVVLGVAVVLIWLLTATGRVTKWMKARGLAEQLRGQIFHQIVHAPLVPGTDERIVTAQKHGLMQAAYIDHQQEFFSGSINRFKGSASRWTPSRISGYVLFGIVGLMALPLIAKILATMKIALPQVVADMAGWLATHDADRWRVAVATVASSVMTHASAKSAMAQDARNVAMYTATAARVADIVRARSPDVTHDVAALKRHLGQVQQVLETEHFAWFNSPPELNNDGLGVKVEVEPHLG